VEKSKRGTECQKIGGIPLMTKVKSILPYFFVKQGLYSW